MNTVQSNKGYSIPFENLTATDIHAIRTELTVQQISHPDFPPLEPFGVWDETSKYLRLPVHWAKQRYGEAQHKLCASVETSLEFTGSLRPAQQEPVELCVEQLRRDGRGILCLITGGGKTVCALRVASLIGQKTLVIVHKRSLMEQWRDEIRRFLPAARVGIWCQKRAEFGDDYDITIGTWQTLLRRRGIPNAWGLVIVDECHRVCSKEFSQIMFKVNALHVLGLSATPERADGLTCVLEWHLGEIIYRQAPVRRSLAKTLAWICRPPVVPATYGMGARDYSRIINALCECDKRTEYVDRAIRLVLSRPDAAERKVLVLTDRVAHARSIVQRLHDVGRTVGLFVGDQKTNALVAAKRCDIIVATYKIFEEGESVEDLNVLVLATPKRGVTQAVGRIFRKRHEVSPIIVDVADTMFSGQMRARMEIYREQTDGHISYQFFDKSLKSKTCKEEEQEPPEYEELPVPVGTSWTLELDE